MSVTGEGAGRSAEWEKGRREEGEGAVDDEEVDAVWMSAQG